MRPSRFDDLLRLWQDSEAGNGELAELEGMLRSDPRYRRSLVRSIMTEVDLYGRYAVAAGTREPVSPARRLRVEALAALFAVAVSLLAVSYFLWNHRSAEPACRVASGELRVRGEVVRSLVEGDAFDVGRGAPAGLGTREGAGFLLDAGTSGALLQDRALLLHEGGGTFRAGPAPLRVVSAVGTLNAAGAEFSVRVAGPDLAVAVADGSVEVEFAGLKHVLRKGDSVAYGRSGDGTSKRPRLVREAAYDLSAAVGKALARSPGTAVAASLEDEKGRIVYKVDVARGRKLREINLDAKTAAVVQEESEDDDRSEVPSTPSLQDAIRAALEMVPGGAAVEADIEIKKGRARVEVEIVLGDRVLDAVVDLATGRVVALNAGR